MQTDDLTKAQEMLRDLNRRFSDEEQNGQTAEPFFERHLSEKLIFRRANGQTVESTGLMAFWRPSRRTSGSSLDTRKTLLSKSSVTAPL